MNTNRTAYRLAAGVAVAAALLLAWLSLGVGIIGRDGDPANRMYFGVIAVGIIGALIARFRPEGMARALFVTALAQTAVALIACDAYGNQCYYTEVGGGGGGGGGDCLLDDGCGDGGGSGGCSRDSSGYCPASCRTCS